MLDQYRHNSTADPDFAAYKYNSETGTNESCRYYHIYMPHILGLEGNIVYMNV